MKYKLHYRDEVTYEIEAETEQQAIAQGDEFWSQRKPSVDVEALSKSARRLEGLASYKKNDEALKQAAEDAKNNKINGYIARILELKPRIDELLETGNACFKNGIPLTGSAFGAREGYDTNQFITNSWSHLLGFVQSYDPNARRPLPFTKLGIMGGGACDFNLETDGITVDVTGDAIYVLWKFLDRFDTFEKEFYGYVDRVLEKQQKSVDKLISDAQNRSAGVVSEGPEKMRSVFDTER